MPRVVLAGFLALVCAIAFQARPVAAELTTTIDLDYNYTQENTAGDVHATTTFNQRYEIRYETALTSVYDFQGALTLDLQDAWSTKTATVSTVQPTLSLTVAGPRATLTTVYEGVVATTGAYHEDDEAVIYSNSLQTTLELDPESLPEMKLNYQRQRSYQAWTADATAETVTFTARKDILALRLELNFSQLQVRETLPQTVGIDTTIWSSKATYKKVLWGGTDFELSYEIKESASEKETRGVFVSLTESYIQTVRSRLKNSLALGPRMTLGLSWEYQFDQDLFQLTYDYKLKNKYQLDLRWDLMDWFKLSGEARRESDLTAETVGEDDLRSVTDTVKAGFDMALVQWFRVAGKAEFKNSQRITANSGGSVDQTREEKYDLVGRHRIGDFWSLTLNASVLNRHENDWLADRETKLKAELQLKLLGVVVTPSYEISRVNNWDWGFDDPVKQKRLEDAKLDFTYTAQLMDLFRATFTHQYGVKTEDTLDEYLNFESTLQFSETTRINVVIAELIRDLRLEGEAERRASDTEHDEDPQLVEVSYKLRLDWSLSDLSLGSSLTYNDKGNDFDDLTFNTKIGWKTEDLDMSGEYEIAKIFADETSEKRRLNLRLNFKF